jgi:hypothetical protein
MFKFDIFFFSKLFFFSVNDNPPVFDRSIYQQSIPENEKIDTIFLQIHANDRDEGENARISYSIDDSSSTFRINEHTGEIYLLKSLDYEKIRSYSISITGLFLLFLLLYKLFFYL